VLGACSEHAPSNLQKLRYGTPLDTTPAMDDRSSSGAATARAARVLVADDQPDIIAALRLVLKSAGFEATSAASIEEITRQVDASEFDLLLMDLNYARDTTSGAEGLELIGEVHGRHPHLPIVAMTGWANVDTAVEAMRRGARGYLPKPWENAALIEIVRREVDEGRAVRRAEAHATREWTEARAIQQALLPSTLPTLAGVDLAARWEPASGFGGDYYDVMPIGEHAVAVCIADVCGKGLPAALLMSNVQATTRAFMTPGVAPEDAVAAINRALCQHVALGRFVTLFVSIYDLRTRMLRFCNAGHNPPVVVHADGRIVRLSAGGLVAGAFETARYEGGAIELEPGDRVCLFTDGLPEACAPSGAEFGDTRLVDVVTATRALDADAIVDALFREVQATVSGPCQDDATAVVLGVR
jgi:phosphoserine phosphatase RsbU/P